MAQVVGLPITSVVYRDEPRPFAAEGALLLLDLRSVKRVGQGTDASRDPAEGELGAEAGEVTYSQVEAVASCLLESYSHDYPAQDRMMRVRQRLDRTSSREQLAALDACVYDADPIQVLGTRYDQRVISAANLDLRVRIGLTETQAEFDTVAGAPMGASLIEAVEVNDDVIGEPFDPDPTPEP